MELFVFDIDGTLVENFAEMTPAVIDAVNKVLERGDYVAIASGRAFSGVKRYINEFIPSERKFLLCSNAAVVCDHQGNVISRCSIKYSDYLHITKEYLREDAITYLYQGNLVGTFWPENGMINLELECNEMEGVIDFNKKPMKDDDPIEKTVICAEPSLSAKIEKLITPEDREKFNVLRTTDFFIEFMNKEVDKSKGVERLAKILNIPFDHIHTFGDEMNDFRMIKEFDGTAMGNAVDAVKKVAKRITKSVSEDGIAYALKTWFNVD